MAQIITMPRLSDTMEEGTVASWLKKVGDKIEEGDILAEIETDKATMEFESFNEGTLLHIGVQEGETTKVDELLAIIGEDGEDISALLDVDSKSSNESDLIEEKVSSLSSDSASDASTLVSIPDGVSVVTMPRLSDTMEEGTVASWLKKVGDSIEEGEILAEIETDKATMEFESFNAGTLLYIGLQEGESAKVDDLLAIIGPAGQDVTNLVDSFSVSQPVVVPESDPEPKKEPIAEEPKPILSTAGPALVSNTDTNTRLYISPLAKKMALDKGINTSLIVGTGENGRIIKRDIDNYNPTVSASSPVFVATGQESTEDLSNSQMRKTIAKRLAESKFSAPHYYLSVEYNMDNAIAFRNQYNSIPDTKISFNDIVVKACALSLRQHPAVNSQWFDDRIQHNHHVHVGVAVAVEDGLVVPVVKFANEQSLPQIGTAVKDFAGRARNKKLTPKEMEGSTFTISNLGMFGIDSFTSIINQPNSAILSVGAIVQKPIVKDGQIVVGHTMKLTLACDHRTVDGATGAQFLQTLQGYIENPVTMLV